MYSLILIIVLGATSYPLDKELVGSCGGSDELIQQTCKVTKRPDGKYFYTYKLKNLSKKKSIETSWQLLDRATSHGSGIPMWWNLRPNQEITITLAHEEAPVLFTGRLSIKRRATSEDKAWGNLFDNVGLPPGEFYYVNQFGMPGPLPPSFTKRD